MSRVPIIAFDDLLIVTVLDELRDHDALLLQQELAEMLQRRGARGVLLDMSVVETIDSFLGRLLSEITAEARLLGAATVVAGIQPAVAITLVELGLELRGVHTALNPRQGRALLRRLIAAQDQPGRRRAR